MGGKTKPSALDVISTEAWRSGLLDTLSGLSGFDALVRQSRYRNKSPTYFRDVPGLLPQARQIIGAYEPGDITFARQYYNNEHLLHFWIHFNSRLDELDRQGVLDPGFPLFHVSADAGKQIHTQNSVPIEALDSINLELNVPSLRKTGPYSRNSPVLLPAVREPSHPGQAALDKLFIKMSLVNKIEMETMCALYDSFIEQHRRSGGVVWDYYRIHFFLDNYLYMRDDGLTWRSHFEFIFLNNNLYELKLYLQDSFDKEKALSLDDVIAFLKRQRQFYAKTALTISLLDNEIRNNRKDLYVYDEETGVVLPKGVTDSLREDFRKKIVEGYGLRSQGGCPFARSSGLKKNALIEVFEYSDTLMIGLLEHAKEFGIAFNQ